MGIWRQGKLEGKGEVLETGGKLTENPADRISREIEALGKGKGGGCLQNIKEAFRMPEKYRRLI